MSGRCHGAVTEFDDGKGWGTVRSDSGIDSFFHCTSIGDGSRTIAVGTRVEYDIVAGHRGRWEAADLRPAPPA